MKKMLLNIKDVMTMLDVSDDTVDRLRLEGELVSLMVRSSRKYTLASVEAYVARQIKKEKENEN